MLWLLSLLAAFALAQNCDVSSLNKAAQKRRECKKRAGCKWSGRKEVSPGNFEDGKCSGSTTCGALTQNQCKKRNNCFINWTANGKPCQNYNKDTWNGNCNQLAGKKNFKKCAEQAKCINGSGDRQDKDCLLRPNNLNSQDCNNFSNRPNKNLCLEHEKCEWVIKNKKCIDKKSIVKTCSAIDDRQGCEKNDSGCKWTNNNCLVKQCTEIDDRTQCNNSKVDCQWYQGFNPDDFDPKKNKEDQKNDPNNSGKFNAEGTCRAGISKCRDIMVENHCKLADQKFKISGCHWNAEAKEIPGANRCSERTPCATHQGSTNCQLNNNMRNNKKCVWQKSGNAMRCMEYACDDSELDTKNKCNTVGCFWHRNKDKRDPESKGYCGVLDYSKGRRL